MLVVLALAQATPVPPANGGSLDSPIVITAQMKRDVQFTMRRNRTNRGVCRIKRTSGSEPWDRAVCEEVEYCMGDTRVTSEQFTACLNPRLKAAEERLAVRREANRD